MYQQLFQFVIDNCDCKLHTLKNFIFENLRWTEVKQSFGVYDSTLNVECSVHNFKCMDCQSTQIIHL